MVAESKAARYEAFSSSKISRPRSSHVLRRAESSTRPAPPSFVRGFPMSAVRLVRIDAVLAQVVRQIALIDPEKTRRLLAQTLRTLERLDHDFLLATRHDRTDVQVIPFRLRRRPGWRRQAGDRGEIESGERGTGVEDEGPFDDVAQLPHV